MRGDFLLPRRGAAGTARELPYDARSSGTVSIESVSVGLGGKYKVGCWTPVWVTVAGGDTAVSGRLELTDAGRRRCAGELCRWRTSRWSGGRPGHVPRGAVRQVRAAAGPN